MIWVKQYLLSVVAAAIVCAIVKALMNGKSTPAVTVKFLASLLMAITVIAPIMQFETGNIREYFQSFQLSADAAVREGVTYYTAETAAIIKETSQAYILDKAQSLGATIDVEIMLSDETPQIPCAVEIRGNVSPYAKKRLMQYISEEFGIAEENQVWI